MSGLIGCFKDVGSISEIEKGGSLLTNNVEQTKDELYQKGHLLCSRVHLKIIGEKNLPLQKEGLACWIEGEFYNVEALRAKFKIQGSSEAEIILEAFQKGILKKLLEEVDGFFCCVIHNSISEKVHFISDRFGLKPFYLWEESGKVLAWSSEVKGFFSFDKFEKKISKENMLNFLTCGHHLENTTMFEQVNLITPSSILSIDCKSRKRISLEKYWKWSNIKPINISFEKAATELGELLKKAVHSRMKNEEKLCISLSGGLDSRMILAASKELKPTIDTFTFGIRDSYEQGIAAKVAKAANVKNYLFSPDNNNWFNKRIEGVWKTDGMLNLVHMHGSNFQEAFSKVNSICLNGIGGGILLGGRMLKNDDQSAIKKAYGEKSEKIDTGNEFFHLENKECQYLINNRLRRFTLQGLIEQKYMEYRMPFFHNELIDFLFSIPDTFRAEAKLFQKTLLQFYPELFDKIPYSNISYPISGKRKFRSRLERKIHYLLHKYKLKSTYNINEYPKWFSQIQPLTEKILYSEKAIYKTYLTSTDFEFPMQDDFLKRGRLLTLEIYLQQVFNKRFLTTEDFLASVR